MVDELTGYQYLRARRFLEQIRGKFLHKELGKWAKRFSDEFYKQTVRLRGWDYEKFSIARPPIVGKYTIDLVYAPFGSGRSQTTPQAQTERRKKTSQTSPALVHR
jgi:P63C domain